MIAELEESAARSVFGLFPEDAEDSAAPEGAEVISAVDAETALQAALGMVEIRDRGMVLAFAMLVNLAEDLALLHRHGHWRVHPVEMAAGVVQKRSGNGGQGAGLHGGVILRELQSEKLQGLFGIIAAGTMGKMRLNTGFVVRMARQISSAATQRGYGPRARSRRSEFSRRMRAETRERRRG